MQAKVDETVNTFLLITAKCAPSILMLKPKFHFLVHLTPLIRRFGPAVLASTERYESFNSVFRLASILSNRQAPSRDISRTFAGQDAFKHVATGGYFRHPKSKRWVRAGHFVTDHLRSHKGHARLIGLNVKSEAKPGKQTCILAFTGVVDMPITFQVLCD